MSVIYRNYSNLNFRALRFCFYWIIGITNNMKYFLSFTIRNHGERGLENCQQKLIFVVFL